MGLGLMAIKMVLLTLLFIYVIIPFIFEMIWSIGDWIKKKHEDRVHKRKV